MAHCQGCADLLRERDVLRAALAEVREYADDRADADWTGDPPTYVPNAWMQIVMMIDGGLR